MSFKQAFKKTKRIRNFIIGISLISLLGTKGRAYVYDWIRARQKRMEEEQKKKKHREAEARKFVKLKKRN